MTATRRQVVAASAGAAVLAGCDGFWRWASNGLGAGLPDSFTPPAGPETDPVHHALSRMAFGPRPGDVERVRSIGVPAYVEEQLAPEALDDVPCDLRARRFESLHMSAGNMQEWKREVAWRELARATVLRAVYSSRQLLEVMVEFWTDHFNIDTAKAECSVWKTPDDRDVIRRHALGRFPDLVRASALSPAMLVYLDGRDNKKTKPEDKPNENYARELLELHTLGVHGGYSQRDVMEVARCLTGWTVDTKGWKRGKPRFSKWRHDRGPKAVLGVEIPASEDHGERDLDRVLEIVTSHASTARFLAGKLCRRFVADEPPPALVARAAGTFSRTGGDIRAVLRTILLSEESAAARGARLKRPFRFVVSALRGLGADTDAGGPVLAALERMGQAPFQYPTPDGYPDEAAPWLGTLLWRWNFAVALASGRVGGTKVDLSALARAAGDRGDLGAIARHLLGRDPSAVETRALGQVLAKAPDERTGRAEGVGLLLATPAFQRF
ncbi:MAG: DUF1800 domain-containing protein [Planctomycetales bacterium]|nr:DUF1800 domain-containing protein [Planctomycetales bacterium]